MLKIQMAICRGMPLQMEATLKCADGVLGFEFMLWHCQVLELFLNRGCNIEARNFNGYTVLHCAAASGRQAIVQALIDRKADIR